MNILNLYAGIGGNRKLLDSHIITAVENNNEIAKVYKNFFPNDIVIVDDAHDYLLKHFKEFDFIWSSPPCPTHSKTNFFLSGQGINRYPDLRLYQEIIFLKYWFKGKWVVENVIPYYEPLIEYKKVGRHAIWCNFEILNKKINYTQVGTMNRLASKEVQRKATIREGQIPEFLNLYNLKDFKIKNKRQVLRNCVYPEIGLYILNCALK